MTTLNLIEDGTTITAGDEVTVNGVAATVTALEYPDEDFTGCLHLKDEDGKEFTCCAADVGADWFYKGQPIRWDDSRSRREDFDSGRWTDEDTASMERGRDLPRYNDAGEPM